MNKPILLNEILMLKHGGLCFLFAFLLLVADADGAPRNKNDPAKENAADFVRSVAFEREGPAREVAPQ